jgi:hypothetical protein
MNKALFLVLSVTAIIMLGGWGTPEANTDNEKKQAVNFSGSLATWANPDTLIAIDNISFDHLYKKIPLYIKPAVATQEQPRAGAIDCSKCSCCNQKTIDQKKYKEFALEGDPHTTFIEVKVDLVDIAEIIVPNPDQVWTYQKEKGYSKTEYIEVVLIANNTQKTETCYLAEKRKKIYADRINTAGTEEQIIPLEAIKSLKITGYADRSLVRAEQHKQAQQK